jgi:hypothetical protein
MNAAATGPSRSSAGRCRAGARCPHRGVVVAGRGAQRQGQQTGGAPHEEADADVEEHVNLIGANVRRLELKPAQRCAALAVSQGTLTAAYELRQNVDFHVGRSCEPRTCSARVVVRPGRSLPASSEHAPSALPRPCRSLPASSAGLAGRDPRLSARGVQTRCRPAPPPSPPPPRLRDAAPRLRSRHRPGLRSRHCPGLRAAAPRLRSRHRPAPRCRPRPCSRATLSPPARHRPAPPPRAAAPPARASARAPARAAPAHQPAPRPAPPARAAAQPPRAAARSPARAGRAVRSPPAPAQPTRPAGVYPSEKRSIVPVRRWSFALPSGSITWPSTTIGLFQWPAAPASLVIGDPEPGA